MSGELSRAEEEEEVGWWIERCALGYRCSGYTAGGHLRFFSCFFVSFQGFAQRYQWRAGHATALDVMYDHARQDEEEKEISEASTLNAKCTNMTEDQDEGVWNGKVNGLDNG